MGSEMCIRDSIRHTPEYFAVAAAAVAVAGYVASSVGTIWELVIAGLNRSKRYTQDTTVVGTDRQAGSSK